MRPLVMLICALTAFGAGADTIGDVKSAVKRLEARQPVRGTFSTEATVTAAGKFANENTARRAWADVAHDATGLSITIPKAVLEAAAQTARAAGGGVDAAQKMIGSLRTTEILEALDFRDPLLRLLDRATVTSEKRVVFGGRPARLLELKLEPRQEKESGVIRVGTAKVDHRMMLWVADNHLPLAAKRIEKTTVSVMFIRGSNEARKSYTFGQAADRLILARVESSDRGSGMGQNVERDIVQTLTLR